VGGRRSEVDRRRGRGMERRGGGEKGGKGREGLVERREK
jgi:hypothetical protein